LRGSKSQEDFASELGIPFRTYQRYEAGERAPKKDALEKISQKCGVTVDYILTGELSAAEKERMMLITDKFMEIIRNLPEEDQQDLLKMAKEKKRLRDLIEEHEKWKNKD